MNKKKLFEYNIYEQVIKINLQKKKYYIYLCIINM